MSCGMCIADQPECEPYSLSPVKVGSLVMFDSDAYYVAAKLVALPNKLSRKDD